MIRRRYNKGKFIPASEVGVTVKISQSRGKKVFILYHRNKVFRIYQKGKRYDTYRCYPHRNGCHAKIHAQMINGELYVRLANNLGKNSMVHTCGETKTEESFSDCTKEISPCFNKNNQDFSNNSSNNSFIEQLPKFKETFQLNPILNQNGPVNNRLPSLSSLFGDTKKTDNIVGDKTSYFNFNPIKNEQLEGKTPHYQNIILTNNKWTRNF